MGSSKISERMRRQLEKLPPEKRAKAEAAYARTQTPEFRALANAQRALLDREYQETGTITPIGHGGNPEELDRFIVELKREREARGMSLSEMADRTGIDKAALSRLENGQQPNPTVSTLTRYANALGKRLGLSLIDGVPSAR